MKKEDYCKKCREVYEYAPCCSIGETPQSEKVVGAKFKPDAPRQVSKTGKVCALCPQALPHACALGDNRPENCKQYPSDEDIANGLTCPDCLILLKLQEEFEKTRNPNITIPWKEFLKKWKDYL